jgi:hypothetical protein
MNSYEDDQKDINSTKNVTLTQNSNSSSHALCKICKQEATGFHYGGKLLISLFFFNKNNQFM